MIQFHYLESTESLVYQRLTEHILLQILLHIPTKNKMPKVPDFVDFRVDYEEHSLKVISSVAESVSAAYGLASATAAHRHICF